MNYKDQTISFSTKIKCVLKFSVISFFFFYINVESHQYNMFNYLFKTQNSQGDIFPTPHPQVSHFPIINNILLLTSIFNKIIQP